MFSVTCNYHFSAAGSSYRGEVTIGRKVTKLNRKSYLAFWAAAWSLIERGCT